MIAPPILVINLKAYPNSFGTSALELAKLCEKTAKAEKISIILAVPPTEIAILTKAVKIPIFAEHVDAVAPDAYTGAITLEAIESAGAIGTLVNHAERQVSDQHIEWVCEKGRELGLNVLVCARDDKSATKFSEYYPFAIAVEPPALIGGDISVSTAEPKLIENSVKKITGISPEILPLVGAGIKSKEDARVSIKLGAAGILVSSAVTRATHPGGIVKDLVKGLKAK